MVLERLDKCFGHFEWVDAFLGSMVKCLNFWCFDYRPLLVNVKSPISGEKCGRNKMVYFELAWSYDLKCSEIFISSWLVDRGRWSIKGIVDNFENVSNKLFVWGRGKF